MAADNYAKCLQKVLEYEGGYVNHPRDPGGETNYGVTVKVARAHGYTGPMRSIPMSVVREIYRKGYWNTVMGDRLAVGVDLAVFDFGVNSGPARAMRYLKSAAGGSNIQTIRNLCAARLGFVRALGTFATFGKGWTRRIVDVEATGIKMALSTANSPAVVSDALKSEAKKAQTATKRDATVSGGTATAGGASQAPESPAQVDWSAFDFSALAGFCVAAIVVLAVVYFARRAYINHERAKAYEAAAKET